MVTMLTLINIYKNPTKHKISKTHCHDATSMEESYLTQNNKKYQKRRRRKGGFSIFLRAFGSNHAQTMVLGSRQSRVVRGCLIR